MIIEALTDIFDADIEGVIHQANCHCTMGSGIAKTIREKFPEAYETDCRTKKGDLSKMGKASIAWTKTHPKIRVIFNLYGQGDFGTDKRYTSYDALENGFSAIKRYLYNH